MPVESSLFIWGHLISYQMSGSYLAFYYISNTKISFTNIDTRFQLINTDILWTIRSFVEDKMDTYKIFKFHI